MAIAGNRVGDIGHAVQTLLRVAWLRRRSGARGPWHRPEHARGRRRCPTSAARHGQEAQGRHDPLHRADDQPAARRGCASTPTAGPSAPRTASRRSLRAHGARQPGRADRALLVRIHRGGASRSRDARSRLGEAIATQQLTDSLPLWPSSRPSVKTAKCSKPFPTHSSVFELENGHEILGLLSGKMRMYYIKILPGDKCHRRALALRPLERPHRLPLQVNRSRLTASPDA